MESLLNMPRIFEGEGGGLGGGGMGSEESWKTERFGCCSYTLDITSPCDDDSGSSVTGLLLRTLLIFDHILSYPGSLDVDRDGEEEFWSRVTGSTCDRNSISTSTRQSCDRVPQRPVQPNRPHDRSKCFPIHIPWDFICYASRKLQRLSSTPPLAWHRHGRMFFAKYLHISHFDGNLQ